MEEKIFYDSTDNIKLCGLLSKVNDSDKITILCHGIRGNKNERISFTPLTEKLQKNNINSFRFDFRAHGESSGIIDDMVPYQLSEKISKMCKDSKLELIPNGNHTFDNDKEALDNAIDVTINFIKELLSRED